MLITASRLVPAGANITRAPTPIIAASVLMPTASGGCGKARNKQLRTDLVDEAVWEEVCRLLEHPERLEQEYRRRLVQEEQTPNELGSLEARMGRLRQGIARLIDSYAEGLIDKAEFEPRIARMRERLMQIEAQAQQIKDEASLERELTLILGRLDEFAARIKTGLYEADWLTRREIIRALVKRVEIDQEQVRVVFRVNPPPPASQFPSEKDAQSLQHCKGRAQPNVVEYLPEQTGHLCRNRASANLHTRNLTTSQRTLWVSPRACLTSKKIGTLGRSPIPASADAATPFS